MDKVRSLFSQDFMPHGMCYAWQPEILWLNVISDLLIVAAYLSIPIAIIVFVRRRTDLEFIWVFRLFAAFIFCCAMTHSFGIWVVWQPDYFMHGIVKLITAIVSITTAFFLWPLMPKALALPSPKSLVEVNEQLKNEINEKLAVQKELQASHNELEKRVAERTIELKLLNEQLLLSNEELEEFAYAATHDLKEPLRAIKTYTHYIYDELSNELNDEIKNKLLRVQELIIKMRNLIDSLLFYSKVGNSEQKQENIDPTYLVSEAKNSLGLNFEEKSINVVIDNELPLIKGDSERLLVVFQNLISNAIKYNDNKVIDINIGSTSPEKLTQKPDKLDESQHIFYIKDNGIGIADRHHTKIFKIFKRLHLEDAYRGGTGAGLTIIKRVIERHGGLIWIDSELEKGTIVYFSIPAS